MATAVGADLLDLVESGGRGRTREAVAVFRTGALRHWRDITAPYRKLDLQLPSTAALNANCMISTAPLLPQCTSDIMIGEQQCFDDIRLPQCKCD
jgi:hypothetical protein